MKTVLALVPGILLAGAAVAAAQDVPLLDLPAGAEVSGTPEAEALPTALVQDAPARKPGPGWALGARAGYLRARDADEGTWFGGVQVRIYLVEWLAVEGSIEVHQSDYLDDDVTITQYPVQLTGLVYLPVGDFPLKPYGLGGAGWYYTRIDYSGTLSALDSETESVFGVHVGGGAELMLGGTAYSLSADVRYVFLDEPGVDNSNLEDEEADYWQATAAFNIRF